MGDSRIMSVLKLRPIIFGLSIFNLIWMWALTVERLAKYALAFEKHVHPLRFYEEAFLGLLLLLAALGLLLKRLWSQSVALIFSAFVFYCVTIFSFWNLACIVEVPLFSYSHLSLWYPNMFHGQLLHIVLSSVILCCAAASITEWVAAAEHERMFKKRL
jgi:hypothetical protein